MKNWTKWETWITPIARPTVEVTPDQSSAGVVLTGVRIPFFSLVGFLVKLSLAAIPAAIILALIYFVLGSLFIGGLMHR